MSVKVMGLVWDLKISREEKFILLAYADHADHDGESIFPAVSTIAEKTGYSKRSVQRITRLLEESGYLVPVGGQKGGVGITAKWYIPIKDDKIAPIAKGDTGGDGRVPKTTLKGDIAVSSDPSLTTKEPSIEDIEKIGGAGFYIFNLVGYNYDDVDAGTRALMNQYIYKYGETRLCRIAAHIFEDYPEITLRGLLGKLEHYADLYRSKYDKEKELEF